MLSVAFSEYLRDIRIAPGHSLVLTDDFVIRRVCVYAMDNREREFPLLYIFGESLGGEVLFISLGETGE